MNEFYCLDCCDDFVTAEDATICTQCLSPNIIKQD
jgi:hypothetical protein